MMPINFSAGTLDPVAAIGDVIIVSNYAKVDARSLVVTAFGEQLLARRYNEVEIHPHIAVLTGQATDPYALAKPIIAPREKITLRKIIATLFTSSRLPIPPKDDNVEFVAITDIVVINNLLRDTKLFKVSGRSAEPIALDGQFIMTQPVPLTPDISSKNGWPPGNCRGRWRRPLFQTPPKARPYYHT